MLASILFTIFAWAFVGALIIASLYWVGVLFAYVYHSIKGTPSTGNGAADVIDRYLGHGKSYNVRIDITTDKKEDNKECDNDTSC
jgi:hypothetical protein